MFIFQNNILVINPMWSSSEGAPTPAGASVLSQHDPALEGRIRSQRIIAATKFLSDLNVVRFVSDVPVPLSISVLAYFL